MIQLFKVRMSKNAPSEVEKVLNSGFVGQGKKVEEFEDLLWKELNSKNRPITVNSCTSAIDLALELCNVGSGDEVISTPQTCFASNIGPIHRKATIRWADINPITGLIDPDSVSKLITNKTKAIIAVNWAGNFCNYNKLKSFGIPVIEDAAHCWGSLEDNIERGDYICYSFQAIKFLTCGDGGLLITEKEEDARLLRWYGLDRTKNQSFRCTQNIKKAGFKYHMNDIAAAIGITNIPEASDSVMKHRENSIELIGKIKNSNFILPEPDNNCSYWLFSMHVLNGKKNDFIKYLENNEISSSPVHFRNDRYDSTIMFSEQKLPGVDSFSETQVCIPNGWWLSQEDKNKIVEVLNKF